MAIDRVVSRLDKAGEFAPEFESRFLGLTKKNSETSGSYVHVKPNEHRFCGEIKFDCEAMRLIIYIVIIHNTYLYMIKFDCEAISQSVCLTSKFDAYATIVVALCSW